MLHRCACTTARPLDSVVYPPHSRVTPHEHRKQPHVLATACSSWYLVPCAVRPRGRQEGLVFDELCSVSSSWTRPPDRPDVIRRSQATDARLSCTMSTLLFYQNPGPYASQWEKWRHSVLVSIPVPSVVWRRYRGLVLRFNPFGNEQGPRVQTRSLTSSEHDSPQKRKLITVRVGFGLDADVTAPVRSCSRLLSARNAGAGCSRR